jgi:hypothetical protein
MWRRVAVRVAVAILALVVALDVIVLHRPHFEGTPYTFDTSPFFYPGLGFFGTVALVLISRALGIVLSRRENYYRGR